jgi:phosphoglycerol transferase MdoB-like AlkP superfamily enzyme
MGQSDGQDPLIKQVRPATETERTNWPNYLQKSREEAPARIEEAAKYLSGIVSLSFVIVLKPLITDNNPTVLVVITLLTWILSVILGLYVVFPFQYRVCSGSAESIIKTLDIIVKRKKSILTLAIFLYLAALCLTITTYLIQSNLAHNETNHTDSLPTRHLQKK